MASLTERETVVEAWCDLDRAAALVPADRQVIGASTSLRVVIVDFARSDGLDEELYDACASLGRMIAHGDGSPTLASCTIDHACRALNQRDPPWLGPARAALIEAYTSYLVESARQDALGAWEFSNCTVLLPDGTIAIAAGFPSSDPEELSAWAARVAKSAALKGVRRAYVSGAERARQSIKDALAIVGIAT